MFCDFLKATLKLIINFFPSEFFKLDAEQKLVRNLIASSNSEYVRQHEHMKQQIEMLERENQKLIEEKIQFLSGHKPIEEGGDQLRVQQEDTRPLLEMIEKFKSELELERKEKLEIQDALKRSVEFQEKLLKEFDSELSEI